MTNVAIYFNGRCGSTWLTDYLLLNMNNNGVGMDCLWEYWGENRLYHEVDGSVRPKSMHTWKWAEENINQDELFDEKVRLLRSTNANNNFIRFTEHEGYVDKPFDYMLTSNTKWIVMNRRDRFDQMISHAMCWITDRWHVWTQEGLDEYHTWYSENPITIPKDMCENWLRSYLRFVQRRRRLQESGLLLGQVTYEKMQDDAVVVAKDLLAHFGVASPTIANPVDNVNSTLKLGTPSDKSKWVSNYNDLLEWYRGSDWPAVVG